MFYFLLMLLPFDSFSYLTLVVSLWPIDFGACRKQRLRDIPTQGEVTIRSVISIVPIAIVTTEKRKIKFQESESVSSMC